MSKFHLNNLPMDDNEEFKGKFQKKENKKPKLTDKTKKNKGTKK
jgi:hypothetical protein